MRIIILLILIVGYVQAQNLVPNGDFETYTSCPTATSKPGDLQITKAFPWTTPTNGTADYFNGNATCNFSPEAACGGNGYGGIFTYIDGSAIPATLYSQFKNYREYLSTTLTKSLEAGKVYCVSFSIKRFAYRGNMATDGIGFYFSNTPIVNPGNDKVLPYKPQYETPKGTVINSSAGCMTINGTFCATGGERYITIGNFNDDANTTIYNDGRPYNAHSGGQLWPAAYYQIDNVVVTECAPTLTVNNANICKGQCVDLIATATGGNPPYTYSWSNGPFISSNTNNVCPTGSAQYVVAVKDSKGCILYRDTAQVVVADIITTTKDSSFCEGGTLSLSAPNVAGATYSWSTSNSGPTLDVSASGNYWVKISATGRCDEVDTFKIAEKPNPVVLLRDTTICTGTNTTLNAQNPGASYLWSTGATTQSITVSATGQYSVSVTNQGCIGQGDVQVQQVNTVTSVKDTAMCDGTAVVIKASVAGTSYLWNTGAMTDQIQVTADNTYWVKITGAGQCGRTDTIYVRTRPRPVVAIADQVVCEGQEAAFDAGNVGSQYEWSNGASTQTITTDAAGIYQVIVTNTGCKDTGSVMLTIKPLPELMVSNDTLLCTAGSVKITAGGTGTSYTWNTKATTATITVDQPGDYWVISTSDGCSVSDTVQVDYFQYTPLPDVILCELPEVELNAGARGDTYLWNTGATTDNIKINHSGTYWVEMTKGSCIVRDTIEATGETGFPSLFMPNSFTPNGDGKNELFTGYGEGILSFEMNIFNRWGDLYYTTRNRTVGWDGTYEGQKVQQDVYIYTIKYETMCGTEIRTVNKLGHVSVIR